MNSHMEVYIVRFVNLRTGRFFEKKLERYRLDVLRKSKIRQVINYEMIGVMKI